MPVSPRTRQKGTGALPMVETRNKYAQLMRQGISNAEACRTLNINRRTGMRWRHGRTVTNAQGRAKTYAPISLKAPPTISPRWARQPGSSRLESWWGLPGDQTVMRRSTGSCSEVEQVTMQFHHPTCQSLSGIFHSASRSASTSKIRLSTSSSCCGNSRLRGCKYQLRPNVRSGDCSPWVLSVRLRSITSLTKLRVAPRS